MATLNDWLAERPVKRAVVDAHKAQMRSELRARPRELREAEGTHANPVACQPWRWFDSRQCDAQRLADFEHGRRR